VKWLQEINLLAMPSENLFHTRAYRLFPPGFRLLTFIGSMPVQPLDIEQVDAGENTIPAGKEMVRASAPLGPGKTLDGSLKASWDEIL
jgi:hypothetical protein